MVRFLPSVAAALIAAACAFGAQAQDTSYPNKPIKVIVAYPAGGGTDAAGRQMAQRLQEDFKVDVYVENRAGAGGGIGTQAAARSAPDGYTLAVGGVGTQIAAKTLFPDLALDPMKELAPVALLSSTPLALVVGADSPLDSVEALIEAAKKQPGGLVYASGGAGSMTHLAVELFRSTAGLELQHVPYKGSSPANVDLVAGRVDFMMDILSSVTPLINAGRLRLLAVTTTERLPQFPDVPTVSETQGLENYEANSWTGLFAPKDTDPAIIQKVSDAMNSPRDEAQFRSTVEANGAYYTPLRAPEFTEFVNAEYARWHPVVEQAMKQ